MYTTPASINPDQPAFIVDTPLWEITPETNGPCANNEPDNKIKMNIKLDAIMHL